jgi:hypothetical protein
VSLSVHLSNYNCTRVNSEPTLPSIDILQQVNTLKAKPDEQLSAASTIAALKRELAKEQFARKDATKDAEVCMRAARELKEMVDQLLAQVTPLETQIGVINSTFMDVSNEL